MEPMVRELEMKVPKAVLFNVITDFPKYPEFVDEVVGVTILKDEGSRKTVKFELEVVTRFEYVLDFTIVGQENVSWTLLSSTIFKKNDGSWALTAAGNNTKVVYKLDVSFGFLIPAWISRRLTETNLPKMLKGFEIRAKTMEASAR